MKKTNNKYVRDRKIIIIARNARVSCDGNFTGDRWPRAKKKIVNFTLLPSALVHGFICEKTSRNLKRRNDKVVL